METAEAMGSASGVIAVSWFTLTAGTEPSIVVSQTECTAYGDNVEGNEGACGSDGVNVVYGRLWVPV